MFDQLRKAFSNATRSIVQKELTDKDIDNILSDLEIALLESDIAQEVIDDLVVKLKTDLVGTKLEKGQNTENIININLRNAIVKLFLKAGEVDLLQKIKEKKQKKTGPFVIAFLGINGTGKTTTVAKVANLLRKNNISVVLAAGDTHRAGAIEQLSRHAERLSLKVIAQKYGADPSAVGRDAVDYAKKHYIDAVLVDTAGRMQTAKNLMDEINKIVRVVKPDIKLFVGDALAGNDTINQARDFFQYTNFDAAILTKIDADAKGGAAISIMHITSKPIIYLGIGQGYDDIVSFDAEKFIHSILKDTPLADAQDNVPNPLSKDDSSADVIFADRQKLENPKSKSKLKDLSEDIIVSRKSYESSQLGDPNIEIEKHGINENQHGQAKSTSPTSENNSTAIDSSPQNDLSFELREKRIEDKDTKSNIDKGIKSSQTGHLDELEETTRSSASTHSIKIETNHSEKMGEEKNKKTRFGGLFSGWKKDKKLAEDQIRYPRKKDDGQKESVSGIEESGRNNEMKVKEDPGGKQENKKRNDR
jgi:fused signal recognition particle receptor